MFSNLPKNLFSVIDRSKSNPLCTQISEIRIQTSDYQLHFKLFISTQDFKLDVDFSQRFDTLHQINPFSNSNYWKDSDINDNLSFAIIRF